MQTPPEVERLTSLPVLAQVMMPNYWSVLAHFCLFSLIGILTFVIKIERWTRHAKQWSEEAQWELIDKVVEVIEKGSLTGSEKLTNSLTGAVKKVLETHRAYFRDWITMKARQAPSGLQSDLHPFRSTTPPNHIWKRIQDEQDEILSDHPTRLTPLPDRQRGKRGTKRLGSQ